MRIEKLNDDITLYCGDCIEVMKSLPENSIDTCITDPPYGLGFMGKQWDTFDKSQFGLAGNEGENDLKVKKNFNVLPRYRKDGLQEFTFDWATEVYRVLKPGAILLAFGGTRTYHRLVCAIEDAGFEIRDTIAWVYGSGFPKSYDISKGIDKKAGAKREVVGRSPHYCEGRGQYTKGDWGMNSKGGDKDTDWLTAPATPEAQLWDGWGTALKPAFEPIVVAMKPIDGTFVNNALTWGVAGLNIDGGRVETDDNLNGGAYSPSVNGMSQNDVYGKYYKKPGEFTQPAGRFPANFIHDGSDEVVAGFPDNKGAFAPVKSGQKPFGGVIYGKFKEGGDDGKSFYNDGLGSASRFFYCAKASRSERNAGLEGMEERSKATTYGNGFNSETKLATKAQQEAGFVDRGKTTNHHPTVKPIELMRYLVRLTKTPTGGTVLDPFMGSGTTGCACVLEDRDFIGIEMSEEYFEIAKKRIEYYEKQPRQMKLI